MPLAWGRRACRRSHAFTMTRPLLIVGRGPSVRSFDRWHDYTDVMAVSSGIFAIPLEYRPPAHFVSMDQPKWFLAPLHDDDIEYAWQQDTFQPWAFWADASIQKHVVQELNKPCGYRGIPEEIWEVIPPAAVAQFQIEFVRNLHQVGIQPHWGDYSNVRGWDVDMAAPPSFRGGPIGMNAGQNGEVICVRNSWFMAVQIAQRLGYQELHFIGCDFLEPRFALSRDWAAIWWAKASEAGMDWLNLAERSVLAEVLPCPVP